MSTPASFAGPMPDAVDVVVIGGGIVGVMTAWHLAARGVKALVAEKGRIAGEQSSRNWGWIRQQGRDAAELPIMMEANRLWAGLESECGERFGFRRTGVTYLARDDKQMARYEAWMVHAHAHGLDTRVIAPGDIAELLPGAARHWIGGIHTASDARAEPNQALPALAREAVRRGVIIREGCAVRGLDIEAGEVAGVLTEHGRVRCQQAVLAGGAWSALFARRHGIDLPQLSVISSVAATVPLPSRIEGGASESGFAVRRRDDGGYTIATGGFHELYLGPDALRHARKYLLQLKADPFGTRMLPAPPAGFPDAWRTPRRWPDSGRSPFEVVRILDPRPNMRAIARARRRFAEVFPDLGVPALRQAWAGMIDTMPDVVPVIDRVPSLPGLVVATGMSGHGFGIGPAVGRVVADIVAGRPTGYDLARFRFTRFSDGSPMVPGPSL